jgi:hypothetical protein
MDDAIDFVFSHLFLPFVRWCARWDLNPRTVGYEPNALPLSYGRMNHSRLRLRSVLNPSG